MSDETCTPECYKESHCFTCVTRQFARERDTSKRLREALERIRDERTWIDVDEDVKRCRWCGRPSGEDTTDCPVYIARAALSTSTAPASALADDLAAAAAYIGAAQNWGDPELAHRLNAAAKRIREAA